LDGDIHLSGRPQCPLIYDVGFGVWENQCPANICPLLAKETVLGLASLENGATVEGPAETPYRK
jgi:hypothetical protein